MALNQRVLGSSPSASTIFLFKNPEDHCTRGQAGGSDQDVGITLSIVTGDALAERSSASVTEFR